MSDRPDVVRMRSRLRELVELETPTGGAAGLAEAYALLSTWLDPLLGAPDIERIDGVEHRCWRGSASPRMLLLGHLDTVWPVGTIDHRPFTVTGDRVTGPGTFDMKAGLVIVAEALLLAKRTDVAVLVTSDEEVGSITSRPIIEREAAAAGAVLVIEPSLDGALKSARRGGGIYRIEFHGRGAHAGLEPERGRNALTELARHVLELPRAADQQLGTTVSPTVATAGTVTNVIPERAELHVDVRAWSIAELERVHERIAELQPYDADVRIQVAGGINRPPMEAERSRELLDLARTVAESRQLPLVEAVAVGGASDGNFTAALGIPTLDGLGPDGGGAHAENEWVSLRSMTERAELVAGLVDGWR